MSDTKDHGKPRTLRSREETLLIAAGCIGLAAATFFACGGGSSSSSPETDGGTTTGGTDGGGATGSNEDGGTGSNGGDGGTGTALGCTTSASTVQNASDVVAAAQALSAALTTAQQATIQLSATLANAEQWSNLPTSFIPRNGVMMGDMSTAAQAAAVTLVTVASSTVGTTLFSELRAADDWLVSDGKADPNSYGSGRYYIAFIGTPTTTSPWMLQVAGHHLAYNFTYNGKCTSATPLFDGVEPTSWTDGTTTHAPLEAQRAASVAVIGAISSDPASLLSGTFTDVVNGPTNQNGQGDSNYPTLLTYPTGTTGRGVVVGSLTAANQALVKTAIEAWVKNAADAVSSVLLAEYESETSFAETYVAYSGATDLTTRDSYFRIDGPRVWIEYTIQGGIVYPSKVHFHTLWRDKLSDYGADFADADAGTGTTATEGGAGGGPGGGGFPGGDGGMVGPPTGDGGP